MEQQNEFGVWIVLINKQLSSVEFVQDYLQLRFDGPCISVINPITVKTDKHEITSWDSGFRDLICEQISKIVSAVNHEPDKGLTIIFNDGSSIFISLLQEDYIAAEAIHATGLKNGGWIVE